MLGTAREEPYSLTMAHGGKGGALRAVRSVATAALVVCLSGCAVFGPNYEPGYVEARKANLDAAMAEFDPDSVGEVICDYSDGTVGLNQGFRRHLVFAGADAWEPVIRRLTVLEYRVGATEPYLEGNRSDGIGFGGRLIQSPGDQPDIEEELAAENCVIPPEGAVAIGFREGNPVE